MMKKVPTWLELMNPVLKALDALGGSGSNEEINYKVLEMQNYSEEYLSASYEGKTAETNQLLIEYKIGWAKSYLKTYGHLENPRRKVWALTQQAKDKPEVDPDDVNRVFKEKAKERKAGKSSQTAADEVDASEEEGESWETQLNLVLTEEIEPDQFERLAQRLLRESGFVQVEVTGGSGDGGIDGKGIAQLHGLLSFHVYFQCKRYKGSVPVAAIRDFRGAMQGRADKGLFITTGTFTPDARKEAVREGAPPIDLIDGTQLVEKLKELELGVKTEMVEEVTVEPEWFKDL